MTSDLDRLRRLLATDRLTDEEVEAFSHMLDQCIEHNSGRGRALTAKQASWIGDAYQRLELDADDAENLFSSGKVPAGKPVAVPDVLRILPKAPPGRRPC